MPDFTLEQLESSPEYLEQSHDIQKEISREYISQNGPEPVFSLIEQLNTDNEFISMPTEEQQSLTNDIFDFYGVKAPIPDRSATDVVLDAGISGVKGGVQLAQAIQGLIDIPAGGRFSHLTKELGFDPDGANKVLESFYSDAQKVANKEVDEAEGFLGTIKAMMDNPSTIVHAGVESLPSMVGGGLIGRGVMAVAPKVAPWVAGPVGEGVIGLGSSADQIRSESDGELTGKQTAMAAASGLGTSIFGLVGGRIADKAGFVDIDTMLTAGGVKKSPVNIAKAIVGGGVSEGVFEELPQSVQEQMWQNAATDRPLLEGVPKGAAQGLVVGAAVGGGVNLGRSALPKQKSVKEIEDEISNIPLDASPEDIAAQIDGFSDFVDDFETADQQNGLDITLITDDDKANLEAFRTLLSKKTDEEVIAAMNVATPNTTLKPYLDEIFKERLGSLYHGPQRGNLPDSLSPQPVATSSTPTEDVEAKPSPTSPKPLEYGEFPEVQDVGVNTPEDTLRQERAKQTVIQARQPVESKPGQEIFGGADDTIQQVGNQGNAEATTENPNIGTDEGSSQETNKPLGGKETKDEQESEGGDLTSTVAPGMPQNQSDYEKWKSGQRGQQVEVVSNAGSVVEGQEVATAPTEKQKEAGNYKKAHVKVDGLDISIENPTGSTRSGEDDLGNRWEQEIKADYGYLKGSTGYDKDHVDVFITPGYQGGGDVYIVNQYNQDGSFDEHKTILGAKSEKEALDTYNSNYEEGWDAGKSVTKMSLAAFRKWVFSKSPQRGPINRGGKTSDAKGQDNADQERLPQPTEASTAGNGGRVDAGRNTADAGSESGGMGQPSPDEGPGASANLSKQFKAGRTWAKSKLADPKYGKDAAQLLEYAKNHKKADTDFWKGVVEEASDPGTVINEGTKADVNDTNVVNMPTDHQKLITILDKFMQGRPQSKWSNLGQIYTSQLKKTKTAINRTAKKSDEISVSDKVAISKAKSFDELRASIDSAFTPKETKPEVDPIPEEPKNKVFTEDMYQAALDRMKDRNNKLNSGFDPMAMQDLFVVGGYHFEKGVRGFADWSKQVVDTVGDNWEKYLPDVYSMIRKTDGIDKEGMSSVEEVEDILSSGKENKESFADLYNNDKIKEATEDLIASPDIKAINEKLDSIFGTVEEAERAEEGRGGTYTVMNDIALDWRADLENAAKSRYQEETKEILEAVRNEERNPSTGDDTTEDVGDVQPTAEVQGEEEVKKTKPKSTPKPSTKKKKPKKSNPDAIEDFGEKIGGARKDMYLSSLENASIIDATEAPLSKSFPEPKYDQLLKDGVDKKIVATVRALRDEIPLKPRNKYYRAKMSRWVESVEVTRSLVSELLRGDSHVATMLDKLKKTNQLGSSVAGRAELYEEFGHSKSLKGISFAKEHLSLYRGEKDVTKWIISKKGKSSSFGNWPTELGVGNTRDEALEQFRGKYESLGSKKNGKDVKYDVYQYTAKPGVYWIGKKAGKRRIDLKSFESSKEARTYIDKNQEELAELLKKHKYTPDVRRKQNEERIGKDNRGSKDVTPEMFTDAFGFRGVQFGNWVSKTNERQNSLNNAYDALVDLADILNIPTNAISLNGELGLAFGARGIGGKDAPAAHYEPAQVVINLTKKQGAGSLAHEWLHAMDNYFGRAIGKEMLTDVATNANSKNVEGVRPELFERFQDVLKAILVNTGVKKRSKELDKYKGGKSYYSLDKEIFARVFEGYIIEKASQKKEANDYLANIVEEENWGATWDMMLAGMADENFDPTAYYPYLNPKEIDGVVSAFDTLFKEIKTKKTDKGVALYSKSKAPTTKANISQELTNSLGKPQINRLTRSGKLNIVSRGEAENVLSQYQQKKYSVVWHGTPHRGIEQFSTDNVGTGEGAQAYGYGLYFADKKEVAEWYRGRLASGNVYGENITVNGRSFRVKGGVVWDVDRDKEAGGPGVSIAQALVENNYDKEKALQSLLVKNQRMGLPVEADKYTIEDFNDADIKLPGQLYKVEIPSDDTMLLWDKPLSEQPEKVLSLLDKKFSLPSFIKDFPTARDFYKGRERKFNGSAERASSELSSLGIKGIKYLDGASRDGSGDGYNYVIFDGADTKILDVMYSKDGQVQGFTLPDGKVCLVQDNIESGKAKDVLVHELGVHASKLLTSDKTFNRIKKSLIARKNDKSPTGKAIREAMARVPGDTSQANYSEEILAYLVENNTDVGIVRQVIARIKKVLAEIFGKVFVNKLTADDLRALATIAVKSNPTGNNSLQVGVNEFAQDVAMSVKGAGRKIKGLAQFKEWFGDSKVVDENGDPLVVYHGTGADFNIFNPDASELGIHFGTTEQASDRSDYRNSKPGRRIIPVYLSLKKPYDIVSDLGDWSDMEMLEEYLAEGNEGPFTDEEFSKFKNHIDVRNGLLGKGYDGIAYENEFEGNGYSYIAFNPTQIKSIFNNGEWSKDNPDILKSVAARSTTDQFLPDTQQHQSNHSIFGSNNSPDTIDRIAASNPKLKERWEQAVYQVFDKDDPRRRVMDRASNVTEKTDILTVERLRGKVTADETARFMDDFVQPLLKSIANNKLKTADVEEYSHALHAPERNKRMQQVNASRHIDMVKKHLNTSEREALEEELIMIRSDIIMSGGTMSERQDQYLEVLDRLLDSTIEMENDLLVEQQNLDQRDFTQAEIDKGTPGFLQKKIDNRQRHIEDIILIGHKWKTESPRYAGITDQEAKAIVRKWNSDERISGLKEANTLLAKINRHRLDTLYAGGQLSEPEYKGMINGYKYYVPLHRDVEDSSKPATGRSTGPLGKSIQVAKGSMLEVVDIVAHSVANTQAAINRKHKAKAGEVLLNFVRQNPNTGITEEKQKKVPSHDKDGNIVLYPEQIEAANELYVKVNGERHVLTFDTSDKTVARFLESIKGADAFLNGPMKFLSKITRFLASVNTTLSPEFILSNFARDIQTAGVNIEDTQVKGMQGRVFKNVFPAIGGIWKAEFGRDNTKWGRIYRDFSKNGGKIGWMQSYEEITDIAKELQSELELHEEGHVPKKVFRKVKDLISNSNTAVENGVRLAVYNEMLSVGASKQKAAMTASNLTVDFTRRGASGPAINALYMFFNAGVQGNIRIIKALSRSGKWWGIVGGIGAFGFALQMLAYAAGDDDDSGVPYIDGIPDYEKERNMIFIRPNTGGKYIKIPIPYGYNVFFNIGAEIARAFNNGEKYNAGKGAMRLANTALGSFNPLHSATLYQTITPTVLDPMTMIAENKTFTGSPLMPEENPYGVNKADAYRYWKSASGASKWLASSLNKISGGKGEYVPGVLDFSPETIELWWDTITGSAGRFLKNVGTASWDVAKGEEIETSRKPFIRRVSGEWSNRSISSRYYDESEKIEQLVNNLKYAKTVEEKRSFMGSPLLKLSPMLKETDRRIRALRKNKEKVEARGGATDIFDEKISQLQSNFLKRSASI